VEQEDNEKEEERNIGNKWEDKKIEVKGTNLCCICSIELLEE
jgi:hypothetical protein